MKEPRIPVNLEAEVGVLAWILSNPRMLTQVMDRLTPDHFHDPTHQSIYTAMLVLASRDKPCSLSMVYDELRRKQEAREDTSDLLNHYEGNFSITKTPLDAYVKSVVQAHKCRRLISIAGHIVQKAYE